MTTNRKGLFAPAPDDEPRRTNHALVADMLGREIVNGDFPEGSLLPGDSDLLARFRVSRTVLREAMKTLAAKGLVVPRARIGTRVTPRAQWNLFDHDVLAWSIARGLDEELLAKITEMRLAFEPFAARLAARHRAPDSVKALALRIEAMSSPNHTPESLASADLAFHLALMDASFNPFMKTVGNLVEAALVGIFRLSSPLGKGVRPAEVAAHHRPIVEAIAAGNEEAAARAMESVIMTGRDDVLAIIRGKPGT